MLKLLLWMILLVLCWPLALLALVLWPVVWLLALPFRILGVQAGRDRSGRFKVTRRDSSIAQKRDIEAGRVGKFAVRSAGNLKVSPFQRKQGWKVGWQGDQFFAGGGFAHSPACQSFQKHAVNFRLKIEAGMP